MKLSLSILVLLFSFSAFASDCATPEEYSAHYMGYLAFSEGAPDPVLMWWREEYDDLEPDNRFIGVEVLSSNTFFQSARKILRKKKADTYFIAWADTLELPDRSIEVVKVSFAYSKDSSAYDVAFETILKPNDRQAGEMIATPIPFELGCAANLLK